MSASPDRSPVREGSPQEARIGRHGYTIAALAALALLLGSVRPAPAEQDATAAGLEKYRRMLKDDPWANPALLDADRGEALWKEKRGPRNVSLETCDLGRGPGKVEGAFAELPRYFADAGQVMDTETRIVWCMEKIQGLDRKALVTKPFPVAGAAVKDVGAVATYVAAKSSGLVFAAMLDHAREKPVLALGETLFFRRQGPMDFACATCHADDGKRIRLQELPFLSKPAEARRVIGEWPAYRVSSTHVMTMQHRIYDCYWQMRMPEIDLGSEAAVALIAYLVKTAEGGLIQAPGLKR